MVIGKDEETIGLGFHAEEYEDFKKALREAFAPTDEPGYAHQQLLSLKQGNLPMEDFISQFKNLVRKSKITEDWPLIEIFRKAIERTIAWQLDTGPSPPKTLAEWYTRARQTNDHLRRARSMYGSVPNISRLGFQPPRKAPVPPPRQFYPRAHWQFTFNNRAPTRDPNAMDIDNIYYDQLSEADYHNNNQYYVDDYYSAQDEEVYPYPEDQHLTPGDEYNTPAEAHFNLVLTPMERQCFNQGLCIECGGKGLNKFIYLPLKILNNKTRKPKPVIALIDSGAQENFISKNYVEQNNMTQQPLKGPPITVQYANGSSNPDATIHSFVSLNSIIDGKQCNIRTLVAQLSEKDLILGYPFLEEYNPDIDWQNRTFQWRPDKEKRFNELSHSTNRPVDICTLTLNHLAILHTTNPIADNWTEDPFDSEYRNSAEINFLEYSLSQEMDPIISTPAELNYKATMAKPYSEYASLFDEKQSERFPLSRVYDHKIDTTPEFVPKSFKAYQLSPGETEEVKTFIEENLRKGYIQESESPMASPMFFVGKKDGKLRPCQDYRYLNKYTIKNAYPIPMISQIMDKLKNAKYFTKLDVRLGYNNIRIREGDQWKAAFKTPLGLYEPTVMFFGLTNSPATFQHMMDTIFARMLDKGNIIIYMDDILVWGETIEELRERTIQALEILKTNDLYLKLEKCEFEKQRLEYLGHIISPGKVEMDPTKLDGIRQWPTPKSTRDVRKFMGFCNYYRKFIH
ncbi:hypothetical protein NP233_g7688 [Leucocoprinus birnbaumii]|uniref:Reverse transcriptase domain-containing protein n=1 Tax=Leucocoprinus birnbaumii TaxID=56174 RepID=A0AAD5YPQ7_9AGAR|nr:hypothetical protein NP233_g7688 [Leucocoprinus birnbaumii]